MKRLYNIFALLMLIGLSMSCSDDREIIAPESTLVTTEAAETISGRSAVVCVKVDDDFIKSLNNPVVGVYYSTNEDAYGKDRKFAASNSQNNLFSVNLSNLKPNTTYYYRGVLMNGSDVKAISNKVLKFKTGTEYVWFYPEVKVDKYSAKIEIGYDTEYLKSLGKKGKIAVMYSSSDLEVDGTNNYIISDNFVENKDKGSGIVTLPLNESKTKYYFSVIILNDGKIDKKSPVGTFVTQDIIEYVQTLDATPKENNMATMRLHYDKMYENDIPGAKLGFYLSQTNPQANGLECKKIDGLTTNNIYKNAYKTVSGLTPNTTYFYRAIIIQKGKVVYIAKEANKFTTL